MHQKTATYQQAVTPQQTVTSQKVTPQAIRLSDALNKLDIEHVMEYDDGHKSVDIAIPWAKLYLELEGRQHGFNADQMFADSKRDTHSSKEGFYTKRIPNEWVDRDVNGLSLSIARFSMKRVQQINDQQSILGKLKTGYGILKKGYNMLNKVAEKFEDDEDLGR
jgi:very-short-patch-repair endonuclease